MRPSQWSPVQWSPVMRSSLIVDVELTASNQWDRKSMREVEVIRLSRDALFPTTLPLTTRTVVHSRPSSPVVAESLKLIFVTEGWTASNGLRVDRPCSGFHRRIARWCLVCRRAVYPP